MAERKPRRWWTPLFIPVAFATLFAVNAISSGTHVVHPNPFWVIIGWAITLPTIGVPCFFAGRRYAAEQRNVPDFERYGIPPSDR